MKTSYFASLALAAVAAPAFAGLPSVDSAIQLTDVSFKQDLSSRAVTVNYTLAGTNAVIRADVLTNGVSIGKQYVKTFTGDYSTSMATAFEPGAHMFRWDARKDWPEQLTGDLQVKLCALYPEEAGTPGVYDEFARTVYANDFSSSELPGWTSEFSGTGAQLLSGSAVDNQLRMQNSANAAPNTKSIVYTPAFEGLTDWRISFDLGVYCASSIDWDNWWMRWGYAIAGLDAEGNEVFKLTGTANARGAAQDSTMAGVTVSGTTTGAKTHLTFLRNAAGTFSVFGPNDVVGTAAVTLLKPDAKIVKLKFTIPTASNIPAVIMYGYIDNLKIEDISAAPF